MAQAPYGTVVFIRTEYTDAAGNVTKSLGTGTLVGPNDVLTAEHVVHHSGMTLTHIEISPGFEPAAPTNNLEFDITEDASFIREGGWLQPIPGFGFDQGEFLVNYYGNAPLGEALGDSTSASDVAVIGLNRPLGETFGWLGMRPEADADAGNHTVGYPLYESGHQTVSYSSSGTPTLTENGNFDPYGTVVFIRTELRG
jgi:V8-like Glu-specific endopeptidase